MADTRLTGPVRVRFAPSPTGYLHVGGARTALFNELLRQSLGGALILRIEDTDRERSDEAMTRQIVAALEWIGCRFDEGPHLQSARIERHRERVDELLAAGRAYRCFCTPEELDRQRQGAEKAGERFRYPRTCRACAGEEAERRAGAGERFVVRLAMPDEAIRFADLVRGDVEVAAEVLDDFILLRSDGLPTYHLSVVVDDVDMAVTHVLRGDDHLSNTPKHIALFRALGAPEPTFGHLPLILGPDKKRLSKRTGATSVEEFRAQGILPQALYNYLALLGWTPEDEAEILSREELIERFTVERLNASAAVFDRDKLAWMNARYLSGLPLDAVWPHLQPFLDEVGLGTHGVAVEHDRLRAAVELHRNRAGDLKELAEQVAFYFRERIDYDEEASRKYLADRELPNRLDALRDRYTQCEPFGVEGLEACLRDLAEGFGVKAAYLIHPLRMALSGTKAGPPVFDLVAVMGREPTRRHLAHFIAWLRERQLEEEAGEAAEAP
ncbi:MAG TPA: glutamate--tRNA ligase [Thermoanaerobaculia bacterium]|nr:glutamate--tRNA ligase [Thermoanaerobaculia bacterium]